ncbi:MAG: hypothetical protein H6844_18380 [Alphaproteobacteria bacterium]|nr:hypothetical protein [Alphaproteobacteria bacterium]
MNRQKLHAAALVLPLLGVFLLLSPIIRLVESGAEADGGARAMLYVFGTWIGLIVLAFLLARALIRAEPLDAPPADEPGP